MAAVGGLPEDTWADHPEGGTERTPGERERAVFSKCEMRVYEYLRV